MATVGLCAKCERTMRLAGRGMCATCYRRTLLAERDAREREASWRRFGADGERKASGRSYEVVGIVEAQHRSGKHIMWVVRDSDKKTHVRSMFIGGISREMLAALLRGGDGLALDEATLVEAVAGFGG